MAEAKEMESQEVKEEETWFRWSIASQRSVLENSVFAAMVLLNTAAFGFANRSTGTWVRVAVRLNGSGNDEHPLYESNIFTLGTFSTIKDFWRSGAHATAIVTGITAGAMPYAVLASALVLWFGPYHKLRGFSCSFLCQLVRFERMLTMAAILLCVALKTNVPLGNEAVVKLRTIFGWGTFAFEIASVFSYVLMLILCHAHAKTRTSYTSMLKSSTKDQEYDDRAMACVGIPPKTLLRLSAKKETPLLLSRLKHRVTMTLLVFANVIITVLALIIPTIRFTVRDLAKDFVKTKRRRFSVLGTIMGIYGSTRRAEAKVFWCSWLGIFTLALPFLSSLYLVLILLFPTKNKFKLFFFTLHSHALASADVWFIVIANFAKNVDIISKWIVNDQAEHLCDQVKAETRFDGCMEVTGLPLSGFWWLGAHTLLNNFLHIVLYAAIYPNHVPASVREFFLLDAPTTTPLADPLITHNALLEEEAQAQFIQDEPEDDFIDQQPAALPLRSTSRSSSSGGAQIGVLSPSP